MKNFLYILGVISIFALAQCQQKSRQQSAENVVANNPGNEYYAGGIVRGDASQRAVAMVFTAHDHNDGGDSILSALDRHGVKGAFFFTGLFYDSFPGDIEKIKAHGHYLGTHSNGHLLYMPWENRDSLLITKQEFMADMISAYDKMAKAGITQQVAPVFIPPYEYYNDSISVWAQEMGLQVVNFTPGTGTNADYTTPDMPNYRSSQKIYQQLLAYDDSLGLNGHILLFHYGTDSLRADKYYEKYLDSTLVALSARGYQIVPLLSLIAQEQ